MEAIEPIHSIKGNWRMKKLLTVTALLASTAIACAADQLPKVPTPFIPAPSFTWSGAYLGATAGGGWGNSSNSFDGNIATDLPTSSTGFIGGLYAGYNYALGSFVLGLESDIAWANLRGSSSASGHFVSDPGTIPWAIQANDRVRWLGSTRGRVGYAFGRVLPYVTGGLAYGGTTTDGIAAVGASSVNSNLAQSFSDSGTRLGWSAGAGVEYAVSSVLLRMEWLHYDLGTSNFAILTDPNVNVSSHYKGDVMRLGVGYKF